LLSGGFFVYMSIIKTKELCVGDPDWKHVSAF
jgi:hypothetical protein